MDMELDNMGTQEPQETHDDGEFDEMLKDLWGDDYTTEDDEGADPAPRRETGTPEAALQSKVLDPANGGGDPASTGEDVPPETKEEPAPPQTFTMEQVQARIAQEKQQAVNEFIAKQFAGQVDPYTGKPITTAAELEAYQTRYAEEQLKSQLEGAGLDKSVIDKLIAEHPAVKEAQRATAQAEAYRQQQERVETDNFTRDSLQRLNAKHPDCGVKSLSDLGKTAEGRQALEYWRRGVPLEQAYSAAFADSIATNRAKAAKQQAHNDAVNKSHLSQPKGRASSEKMMDAEELAAYKAFFPNMSDAQLQEMWRKNQ